MIYFFIYIFIFCIPSITINGAECKFVKHKSNDASAELWKIIIPEDDAKKFYFYKESLGDTEKINTFCCSEDIFPCLIKKTAEKFFSIVANTKNSTLIISPAEVEQMACVANALGATQEINEALLNNASSI